MSKKSPSPLLAVIRQLALKNIQVRSGSAVNGPFGNASGRADPAYRDPRNTELTELFELRLQAAVNEVHNPGLMAFLQSVMAEPEVHQILVAPVIRKCMFQGLRVDALQAMAERVQRSCNFGSSEREVVYVATFLHGIAQWLAPGLHPGSSVADVVFTIARSALHRLDDTQPARASLLRLCMGWGNADETSEFGQALVQRIQRAVESLDSAAF